MQLNSLLSLLHSTVNVAVGWKRPARAPPCWSNELVLSSGIDQFRFGRASTARDLERAAMRCCPLVLRREVGARIIGIKTGNGSTGPYFNVAQDYFRDIWCFLMNT